MRQCRMVRTCKSDGPWFWTHCPKCQQERELWESRVGLNPVSDSMNKIMGIANEHLCCLLLV